MTDDVAWHPRQSCRFTLKQLIELNDEKRAAGRVALSIYDPCEIGVARALVRYESENRVDAITRSIIPCRSTPTHGRRWNVSASRFDSQLVGSSIAARMIVFRDERRRDPRFLAGHAEPGRRGRAKRRIRGGPATTNI